MIGVDHALNALPSDSLSVSHPLMVPTDARLPIKWMKLRSTYELLSPRHIPVFLRE
jgi:hypothetical protein